MVDIGDALKNFHSFTSTSVSTIRSRIASSEGCADSSQAPAVSTSSCEDSSRDLRIVLIGYFIRGWTVRYGDFWYQSARQFFKDCRSGAAKQGSSNRPTNEGRYRMTHS